MKVLSRGTRFYQKKTWVGIFFDAVEREDDTWGGFSTIFEISPWEEGISQVVSSKSQRRGILK
jgi:hypothetical protein